MRPTASKVRQAVFNIIRDRIDGSLFLDLYAGTGAVGIEALSRGAGHVVFVDNSQARVSAIKDLLDRFGLKDRAEVIRDEASRFMKRSECIFDIIFADPPYSSAELPTVLSLIDERDALNDEGVVIAEHSCKTLLPLQKGALKLVKTYKYGDTGLSLYAKEKREELV